MRTFNARDLPALFLGFALVLGVFAVAVPVMGKLAMAKESDLKFVAGSVQQAPSWLSGKGGSKLPIIVISVKTDDGLYDLDEQDLSHSREIMNLRPGDRITARVMPFAGYHNIWELKRDGVTIQSYQETYLYQAAMNERGVTGSLEAGLISLILLMAALALRMYFGAWRDSTASVPADAVGSVQGAIRLPNSEASNSNFSHYQPLSSADYPRTYRMSLRWRALNLIVGFGAISVGVSTLRSALAGPQVRVTLVWGILFPIIGISTILHDLKYRVVLFADRIEVQSLVSTRVLRRDEILGRRLQQSGRYTGPYQTILLVPRGAQRPLRVLLVLKTDSAFWEWMDTVPDLDVP